MAEVFAGFLCGYVLALLATPPLALGLLSLRGRSQLVARLFPPGTSTLALGMLLHGVLFFACSAAGIVLGLFLLGMNGAGAALGSPNGAFTLLVAGLLLAVLAPVVIVVRLWRLPIAMMGLVTLALFGWLMPYMARWSSF